MKRILALSIIASVALGILSGCAASSSKTSPEVFRQAIQSKARTLATQNQQYFGQSSYWNGGDISAQGNYQAIWGDVTNYLINYVAYNELSEQSYTDYVTRLVRYTLATSRYASPSQAAALSYGGLGNPSFGFLPITYPGSQNAYSSQGSTWAAMYLGGTFGGGGNW